MLSIILLSAFFAGCVERTITITSEPAGALVHFADEEIGRTPLTVPFTWYGDYEVILRLPGYETLDTHENITPPLYDVPPIDLVSQAFVPWTYRYNVRRHYELQPLDLPPESELIERALEMETDLFGSEQ